MLRRFLDVCNAIDYAHSRGVLHRDIKPGNIIVGKHGETLVIDWGLAKPVGRREVRHDNREVTIRAHHIEPIGRHPGGLGVGTPAYMSPEQARGDLDELGPTTDVYSLGATLYFLLTGTPRLRGERCWRGTPQGATGRIPTAPQAGSNRSRGPSTPSR